MTEADKHIARQLMVIKDGHLALTVKDSTSQTTS